jgi:hypothetical protein
MKKRIVIWTTGVLIFINLPFWDFFTKEYYSYCNADKTFIYTEEAGMDFQACQRMYGYFLCQHPGKDSGDNTLYRSFTLKPWKFWQWREMLMHNDRFLLRFKE